MTIDVCMVTYNSEKWLQNCVKALSESVYLKKNIHLFFVDNASTDHTVFLLKQLKETHKNDFGGFEIIEQKDNRGFGAASNVAAKAGIGEYVFFYNVDTEIFPNAFSELEKAIANAPNDVVEFELRQFPYEHPKYYNPLTLEVSWSSGAAFVLRRDIFELTGGFDETIFMYAEDVELSWRIRALGYKLQYVPAAVTWHYSYSEVAEVKPVQMSGSLLGNLVLRMKYGTKSNIDYWHEFCRQHKQDLIERYALTDVLREGLKKVEENAKRYRKFYSSEIKSNTHFVPQFYEMDYEFARAGAFYENKLPTISPKISILMRTYNRPEVLSQTLESLKWQTYKNFEVVLVEDGVNPKAKEVADKFQKDLDIKYIPLKEQAGRCAAGNVALEKADGEYFCFLDDDDYFYPEHLEVMATLIEENPDKNFFATGGLEVACTYIDGKQTDWEPKRMWNNCHTSMTNVKVAFGNPFPIQAVMFHKSLYEKAGGFDLNLKALEDWDLWLRYVQYSNVAIADKVTSFYKVPAEQQDYKTREKFINDNRKVIFEKLDGYRFEISAQEVYSLIWNPELIVEEQAQTLEDHKKALLATAKEISTSSSWRYSSFLRVIPRGITKLIYAGYFLLEKLIRLIWLLIVAPVWNIFKLSNFLANKVGPQKPNFEDPKAEELHSFIILSRKSLSWKVANMMQKIIKKSEE